MSINTNLKTASIIYFIDVFYSVFAYFPQPKMMKRQHSRITITPSKHHTRWVHRDHLARSAFLIGKWKGLVFVRKIKEYRFEKQNKRIKNMQRSIGVARTQSRPFIPADIIDRLFHYYCDFFYLFRVFRVAPTPRRGSVFDL